MFKLFNIKYLLAPLTFLFLSSINLSADDYYYPNGSSFAADDCCCDTDCNHFYIGAFGGGIYSDRIKLRQTGTAFFTEAEGGPLAVDARGHSRKFSSGFGGVQLGYAWAPSQCSCWGISKAAEVEAFFYRHKLRGELINPTDRLPEHDFLDSFHTNVGVFLVNGVFALENCGLGSFSPYIGVGVGAATLSLHKADSLQIDPPEAGINHFNSKRNDSDWAFAAQGKAGIKFNFCDRFNIFAEYRILFIDSSRYNFGSTVYETHAATSTWDVDVRNTWYNAFAIGIQFEL